MNTGLVDQLKAASADLHARVLAHATAAGYQVKRRADPWCQRTAATLRSNILQGKVHICRYVGAAPMPIMTAAWQLDKLVCLLCASIFDLRADPIADAICDRCGIMTAGEIHPCAFVVGVVLVLYGECKRCHRANEGR